MRRAESFVPAGPTRVLSTANSISFSLAAILVAPFDDGAQSPAPRCAGGRPSVSLHLHDLLHVKVGHETPRLELLRPANLGREERDDAGLHVGRGLARTEHVVSPLDLAH